VSYSSYSSGVEASPVPVVPPSDNKVGSCEARKKDEVEHFSWEAGMLLNGKYRITKLLGDGTFGRVLLAEDNRAGWEVAVKVIRNVPKYTRNAKREAEILRDIREADPRRSSSCVVMHETFTHAGVFFCLVFEVLGASLYDLLKRNRFRGFWMQDIQDIARQCLEALVFLHDDLQLTHTDLKLENVLFKSTDPPRPAEFPREAAWLEAHPSSKEKDRRSQYLRPASSRIKLIDFGNATYELEHHSSVINTRQYRAPEVILAMGWDDRSDMWSTGCILMELYTGELLFRTHDSLEHLALIEKAIEPFPVGMLDVTGDRKREQLLELDPQANGLMRPRWPSCLSNSSECRVRSQRPLARLVLQQHTLLAEFVASLLILDPHRRPSARSALAHPFLFETFPD